MLNLSVLLDEGEAPSYPVLLSIVLLLLVFFTVTLWMVNVVVDDACQALILTQMSLVMADFEHDFTLPVQAIVLIVIVSVSSLVVRRARPALLFLVTI